MKDDGKPNFLHYERDQCVTASQIFKDYVDLLYPLKQDPQLKTVAKVFLTQIWGSLCQRTERTKVIKPGESWDCPTEVNSER